MGAFSVITNLRMDLRFKLYKAARHSTAGRDPMMIKEAVNSPRLRGEMNHSKHHYPLFWSRPQPSPGPWAGVHWPRRPGERSSF